jgi:hypothetical protein
VALRVLPTFLGAGVLSALSSFIALLSLHGTATFSPHAFVRQWILWTSLALFFGLFMGLMLEGRRVLGGRT